jgi:hypothetical protein
MGESSDLLYEVVTRPEVDSVHYLSFFLPCVMFENLFCQLGLDKNHTKYN